MPNNKNIKMELYEWAKSILIAVIIAILIIKFAFAHVLIPTGSMIPTIKINDHMLINKIPMYYRDPGRGEIVVFHGDDKELVKRVIGLPGEIIDFRNGNVYIDGEVLKEDYLPQNIMTEPVGNLKYPYEIPQDNYFVMGDNRQDSRDSRYIGTIDRDKIYALGKLRIWPIKKFGNIY